MLGVFAGDEFNKEGGLLLLLQNIMADLIGKDVADGEEGLPLVGRAYRCLATRGPRVWAMGASCLHHIWGLVAMGDAWGAFLLLSGVGSGLVAFGGLLALVMSAVVVLGMALLASATLIIGFLVFVTVGYLATLAVAAMVIFWVSAAIACGIVMGSACMCGTWAVALQSWKVACMSLGVISGQRPALHGMYNVPSPNTKQYDVASTTRHAFASNGHHGFYSTTSATQAGNDTSATKLE
eukprot:TRINITY_DN1583_c0_g1_i1.p2 TRINITY_DN1583_c0_g1~~TRINITY_DN1583_c0_g1_i1.p2  ORF type:complete len:238 (-),score=20.54 TRINITY_DN1583_c0_g1_i1:778-1491(-)